VSTSTENMKTQTELDHLKKIFQDAYIQTSMKYSYISASMNEMVDAINKRYGASWSLHEISDFLSNCHTRDGHLIEPEELHKQMQQREIENSVYSRMTGGSRAGYAHFFGKPGVQNILDQEANDRGRFLFDAMHMDIISKLQISVPASGENNPAGEANVLALQRLLAQDMDDAAKLIGEWSLEAVTNMHGGRSPGLFGYDMTLKLEKLAPQSREQAARLAAEQAVIARQQQLNQPKPPKPPEPAWEGFLSRVGPAVALGILVGGAMGSAFPIPGLGTLAGAGVGAAIGVGVVVIASLATAAYLYYKEKKKPESPVVAPDVGAGTYSHFFQNGLTQKAQHERNSELSAQEPVVTSTTVVEPIAPVVESEVELDPASKNSSDSLPDKSIRYR